MEASESEEEVAPELPEVEAARDVLRPAASLMLARHLKEALRSDFRWIFIGFRLRTMPRSCWDGLF